MVGVLWFWQQQTHHRCKAPTESIAAAHGIPFLLALASGASGAVALAASEPRDALVALRSAGNLWRELHAPYEAARIQCLAGAAAELSAEDLVHV